MNSVKNNGNESETAAAKSSSIKSVEAYMEVAANALQVEPGILYSLC
jgi:hypothetical protein